MAEIAIPGIIKQDIIIDEEFLGLLPSLDAETFASLESNIMQNGCRDPLVLWGNILIDGHNRYKICMEHDIPFNTIEMEFSSREEALIWIISNQVSRRSLTPIQMAHYRGVHYRAEKKIRGANNQYMRKSEKDQNDPFQKSLPTSIRLAKEYNVSAMTIKRNAKVADAIDAIGEVSLAAKQKILASKVNIDKTLLEKLADGTKGEIAAIAGKIEDGTYEKEQRATTAPNASGDHESPGGAGMSSWNSVLVKLTDGFHSALRKLTKNSGAADLKSSLRSYIDTLEDLYNQMTA